MRTIWLAIIALLVTLATTVLVTSAYAAQPVYVVGDIPAPACDRCVWDGTGFGPLVNDVVVDAARGNATYSNRICLRDVSGALVGTNNVTLACRDSTSVWGDSVTVPFSFVRPAPPAAPVAMRVAI
jgi:hypothetical protein